MMGLLKIPSFSISIWQVSPARRKRCGVRAAPTPGGVPVETISPGSSVMTSLISATSLGTLKDQLAGIRVLQHLIADIQSRMASSCGSPTSSDGHKGGAHRREGVEAFAHRPLADAFLVIAGADIVDRHIAGDIIEGVGFADDGGPVCPMTKPSSAS